MAELPSVGVLVLTGFLGSGKTTLLRRLLREADARIAILVNEFGAVGIDHALIGLVAPDVALLPGGCLCCAVKGELSEAILSLLRQRDQGELPPFEHIVLETSGLAEPGPILSTLARDRRLRGRVHLAGVATVVDVRSLADHRAQPEWAPQVAAADIVCLSKTDLVERTASGMAEAAVRAINPLAALYRGDDPCLSARLLEPRPARTFRGLAEAVMPGRDHRAGVSSFAVVLDAPIAWEAFALWLSLLLHRHGDRVLRVKALLDVGLPGPVALDGVQHVVHAPVHEPAWFDADHRSRIVFITRDVEEAAIRRSLNAAVGLPPPSP